MVDEAAAAPSDPGPGHHRPGLLVGGLHLAVLWAFAVGRPVLDGVDDDVSFMTVHGARGLEVVLFALVVLALIPALAIVVEAVARVAGPRARWWVHLAIVAGMASLLPW